MAARDWKLDDLQELEQQYGLAAELESTNLSGLGRSEDFEAYNMSEILSNLLTDDSGQESSLPFSLDITNSPMMSTEESVSAYPDRFSFDLKAPTAHGLKIGQETITYINRSQPYEIKLHYNNQDGHASSDTLFKSTLKLEFSELRLRNCEQEIFDQWSRDHPMERLLEIDKVGCDGLSNFQNDEQLNSISFYWSPLHLSILTVKMNCLSTEFAARKHGGEKGVPLLLVMDTATPTTHLHRGACTIKVFKDKGADRKQKQDQQKLEKLDVAKLQPSRATTRFLSIPLPIPSSLLPSSLHTSTPSPHSAMSSSTQCGTPNFPFSPSTSSRNPAEQLFSEREVTTTTSIEETRDWLIANRYTAYLSLFANYTGTDLLRLSRKDLTELCGAADGIRLYNALRSRTVRTIYVCLEHEKVYHALSLEALTTSELLERMTAKLNLQPTNISMLLRVTAFGIPVVIDDTVVQNMEDEEAFLLQTIKEESGKYQVVLKEQATDLGFVSVLGTTPRPR